MSLILWLQDFRSKNCIFTVHQKEDSNPSQKFLNTTTLPTVHLYFFTAPIVKSGRERGSLSEMEGTRLDVYTLIFE